VVLDCRSEQGLAKSRSGNWPPGTSLGRSIQRGCEARRKRASTDRNFRCGFYLTNLDHWQRAFDQAHITYGIVRSPKEVTTDPQLLANEVIVPLEGAGEHLKLTVSSR